MIVATTDVHGRVRGWDYVRDVEEPGGLARVATIVETLRARYPDRVVLLDAGDLLQGNPFAHYFAAHDDRRPHPVVDALNALGYDAATPGNHEFNYGLEFLARATGDAAFPYVSANITKAAADSLLFAPFAVIARGGVRVGIVGFTTPGVMVWDRALVAGRVRVRPVAETAPAALRRLADAGVDLRVVVIHSGMDGPSSYDTGGVGAENAAASLAALEPRPHLVIVGHSHREMRDSVINGVHFVQPRNWGRSLSVVYVTLVRRTGDGGPGTGRYRVAELRADLIPLATVPELPRIVRRFGEAHERVRAWAATPLGAAGPGFDGRLGRAQDTPLLDFINEVQRRRTDADLSATALFKLDAAFPPGAIRLRDLAGVYPYENTLRAVRISGRQLKDFLEHSARYYRPYEPGRPIVSDSVPGYDFDVVSGIPYTIDLTQPVGRRIRMTWRGRAVQPTDSFTLALNSYRQEGGGGYAMLAGAPVVYDRGENVRDVLVEEIRRARTLSARDYFTANWAIVPPAAREAALHAFARAGAPAARPGDADSTLLRVLAIADFHGALLPRTWDWSDGRPVGGAAALKSWLDSLARACGCTSVRLDAGDQMQGTAISALQYGRPAVDVLNAMGIDAAVLGNHEFDWSVDTLRARVAQARYPFLAANVTAAGGVRPEWVEPWLLVERGGQTIGVVGLARPGTVTSTAPVNVRGLAFGDMAGAVRRALPALRARGADFIIVLAHEGAVCDTSACRGEIVDFARQLDSGAVDLIVAGHTHRVANTVVNGIPIVQAGSSGGAVAVVDFVRVGGSAREVRARLVTPFADAVRPDPGVEALVARHRRTVDTVAARVVARLRVALPRAGSQYALGRLVADAFRNIAKTDVSLVNNSGIRDGLAGGPTTYGQLFQVLPFRNRLLRLTLRGEALLAALEHALRGADPSAHVGGVELWYDPRRPPGRRITRTRLADGRPVERDRVYTLAVPDFLAGGGSGYGMLTAQPAEEVGISDIDAVIRYLQVLRDPVTAPADRRIHRQDGGDG